MRKINVLDASDAVTLPYPGWQPIETAPKPGEEPMHFLVFQPSPFPEERVLMAEHATHGIVIAYDGQRIYDSTHWMPLPEPPALQSGAGE